MNPSILDQCTLGAFDGTVPFPVTVQRLIADGVEWYAANLIIGGKTYYGPDLTHHQSRWPDFTPLPIADLFDAEAVSAAIRASQAREITYQQFLVRIASAGITYYTVHLSGRKAIYFGRHGDSFTEPFPAGF